MLIDEKKGFMTYIADEDQIFWITVGILETKNRIATIFF